MARKSIFFLILLFTALSCAFVLFYRLDALPLRLWDEGRRAVNALEMWLGESHFLVPTFLSEPDHWGTKPPLLIWLQTMAMHLLGPSVLAVRLPPALATLGTCLFLVYFSNRHLDRPWAGVVASLCLVTAPFFMSSHAARAGDYDAVLVLWLTIGVLYFYVFLQKNDNRALLLASCSLVLALWTKGVAALFFLPGLFLLCVLVPAYRSSLQNWRVYLAVLLPIGSLIVYYFLREQYDPGFMRLLWENELGGRFSQALEGHHGGPAFYVRQLLLSPGEQAWWLCLLVAPCLYWYRSADRSIILFLTVLLLTHLLILTLASTKLLWYAMPQIPLYCLLLGLGFQAIVDKCSATRLAPYKHWVAASALILCFSWPYTKMITFVSRTEHEPEYSSTAVYQNYLLALDDLPAYTLLLPSYNPAVIFYTQLAELRGVSVELVYLDSPDERVHPGRGLLPAFVPGTEVIVCEMDPWLHMDANYHFSTAHDISPCKCLRVSDRKAVVSEE